MNKTVIFIIVIWNLIVFLAYGLDKLKAKRGSWRIPEKTLIIMAFLCGGIGAFFGMKAFHHKTQHKLFTIGVPVCVIINAVLLYFLCTVV